MHTITTLLKNGLLLLGVSFAASLGLHAAPIFLDNYDSDPVGPGNPPGYYSFGIFEDIGVTNLESVSAPNSLYLAVDYTQVGFGTGLSHGIYANPVDLTGATLSVAIKSSADLTGDAPLFAFRITDDEGRIFRTANADLYLPGTEFSVFNQAADTLVYDDGPAGPINLSTIVEVGFLFYNTGDDVQTVFYLDNFQAAIPESSQTALALGLALLALVCLKQRKGLTKRH